METFTINVSSNIQEYTIQQKHNARFDLINILNTLSSDEIKLHTYIEPIRTAAMYSISIGDKFLKHNYSRIGLSGNKFHLSEDLRFLILRIHLDFSKILIIDLVDTSYSVLHEKTYPISTNLTTVVKSVMKNTLVCESYVFKNYPNDYELFTDEINLAQSTLDWIPLKFESLQQDQSIRFSNPILKWLFTILSSPVLLVLYIYMKVKTRND